METSAVPMRKKSKTKIQTQKGKTKNFSASVRVTLKKSVLDPQGQTILQALHSLGFRESANVRVGKFFELSLKASDKNQAAARVKTMCEQLLINPVIEQFTFDVQEAKL